MVKQIGSFWLVIVQDTPQARYPTIPCYHTAGVYYTEGEALREAEALAKDAQPCTCSECVAGMKNDPSIDHDELTMWI